MDKYGVVGNPIEHSISPQIHQAFAQQTKQSICYEKYLIDIEDFELAITRFQSEQFKGLNITLPFKESAFKICDQLSTHAKIAGAVNTLMFKENEIIAGDNTDGLGLIRDITINHHFSLQNKSVLLIGAGGAARGVISAIIDAKPRSLTLTNRSFEKAQQLASEFTALLNFNINSLQFSELQQQFDCIINATSMGLNENKFPLSYQIIGPDCCCYDMVYNKETAFLTWAKQHKAAVILDGYGMLIEQAAEAFYLWRGIRPETKKLLISRIR